MSDKDARAQYIAKEMQKIGIMDTPGAILVGLGLYGKFGANGNAFHPLLNDPSIINTMLVVGGSIMAYCAYRAIMVVTKKQTLDKD
ncbi:MAG: hypothetical protein HWE18_10685 [Gammaproteobacteria bacterium]|nr:hypothetical protein [Gammaproteobacteria bacterium]